MAGPKSISGVPCCLVLTAAALLASHAAGAASPETPSVTKVHADGCSSGTSPAAREAAVLDARKNAVRLWIESQFDDTPAADLEPMFGYLDTYVASSRLTGVKTQDAQTCVELEVYLYEWPLRADLATLLLRTRANAPSVAFVFVEDDETQNTRKFQGQTRVAALITEAFRSKGFIVVEEGGHGESAASERELLGIAQSGEAALARFGVELDADVVVCVESMLSAQRERLGSVRAKAEVRARVIRSSDGRLFERTKSDAEVDCAQASDGHSFALPDAVYKLRDRAIVGAILGANGGRTSLQFRLTIEGAGDYAIAQRIAELLAEFPGVTDASVSSMRGRNALLRFDYIGRIGELVDYLQAGAPGVPALEVARVVENEITARAPQ